MTLLLDVSPPIPVAARSAPPSASYAAWVLYQPDDRRQSLDAALLDSISDHTARYGRPTALLCHPANVDALSGTDLLVCLPQPGGVTPDRGTWGLA